MDGTCKNSQSHFVHIGWTLSFTHSPALFWLKNNMFTGFLTVEFQRRCPRWDVWMLRIVLFSLECLTPHKGRLAWGGGTIIVRCPSGIRAPRGATLHTALPIFCLYVCMASQPGCPMSISRTPTPILHPILHPPHNATPILCHVWHLCQDVPCNVTPTRTRTHTHIHTHTLMHSQCNTSIFCTCIYGITRMSHVMTCTHTPRLHPPPNIPPHINLLLLLEWKHATDIAPAVAQYTASCALCEYRSGFCLQGLSKKS